MRSVLSVVFVASLAAAFVGATAQTTPSTNPSPTTPAPADATPAAAPNNDDTVSCRYEKTTGSLFAKRICHTQKEWHQMNVDSRNLMENLENGSGRQVNPDGGG